MLSFISLPALAICSLSDAVCSSSVFAPSGLQDKYLPDNLDNYQKPDAFIPHYRQPYYDMLINTDTEPAEVSEGANYNSNCQFGVCIPSSGVVEEP